MPIPPKRPNETASALPPHPATVVQAKRPFGATLPRPPHAAKVLSQQRFDAAPREPHAAPGSPTRPTSATGAIQRMDRPRKVRNEWGRSIESPLLITLEQAEIERERERRRQALERQRRDREVMDNYRLHLQSLAALGERDLRSGTIHGSIDNGEVSRICRLERQELYALKAYGSPFKDQPRYLYYMGPSRRFAPFASGWHALSSAIEKLPSLGSLGLGNLCLMRVDRAASKLFAVLQGVAKAGGRIYVVHGMNVMEFGQKHLMSTSLMASTHSASKEAYRRGLFCYKCPSGRYMNNFSVQGLLDGGEVLVPPEVVTEFVGITVRRWMGEDVLCTNLVEVKKGSLDPGVLMIEDFKCQNVTDWGKRNGYYR